MVRNADLNASSACRLGMWQENAIGLRRVIDGSLPPYRFRNHLVCLRDGLSPLSISSVVVTRGAEQLSLFCLKAKPTSLAGKRTDQFKLVVIAGCAWVIEVEA